MARELLHELPDRLEALATALSEGLVQRHGDDAVRGLIQARVVPAELTAYLARFNAPADIALDQYLTHSLYHDGLTLVALACLRVNGELRWETLGDLLPLLKRFASYYATQSPRYAGFRALNLDRLGDFWNAYCADGEWFGLLAEPTRFQGLRLCAHQDMLPDLLNGILGPLWALASKRVGLREADAMAVWNALESAGQRHRQRRR